MSSRTSPVPSLSAVLSCAVEKYYLLVTFHNGFMERRGRGREWWELVGDWVGEYVLVRMCVLCVLISSAVSLRIKMELNSFIR